MWHKKKWIIIAVAAAVVILVVGIIGGVAYAQTTTPTPSGAPKTTLLARVAQILGIDQKKVEDAFAQAQKEQRDQAVTDRLNALVKQGKITQQQADDYKKWLDSRPNVPQGLDVQPGLRMGPKGHMGFPGFHGLPGLSGTPKAPASTTPPKTS